MQKANLILQTVTQEEDGKMKAILELKEMSNGYYKECEKGVKYIRNDIYTNLEAHLIKENNKLCERLRKKNEKIKELKQELTKNKEQ